MLTLQALLSPQRPASFQQTSQMASGRWFYHVRMEWSMTSNTEEIISSLRSGTQIDLTLRSLLHLWPTLPKLRCRRCSRSSSIANVNMFCPSTISGSACCDILAQLQALGGGAASRITITATTSSWVLLSVSCLLCFHCCMLLAAAVTASLRAVPIAAGTLWWSLIHRLCLACGKSKLGLGS